MGNYGITGWSAGSRQSLTYNLKAGQFRGMGRVRVPNQTTIINNNVFTGGYGVYDNHNCGDTTPKWMNWMMGLGFAGTILGGILNLFGIGGGSTPPVDDGSDKKTTETTEYKTVMDQMKEIQEQNQKIQQQIIEMQKVIKGDKKVEKEEVEEEVVVEKKEEEKVEKEEEKTTTKPDFTNGQTVKVRDFKLGSRADISGAVTVNQDGSISIKDVINTYTYKKTGTAIYNGQEYPLYECTGAIRNSDGKQMNITNQQYILVNGELIQPNDMNLSGLGSGTVRKNTTNPIQSGLNLSQQEVNTLNNAKTLVSKAFPNESKNIEVSIKDGKPVYKYKGNSKEYSDIQTLARENFDPNYAKSKTE